MQLSNRLATMAGMVTAGNIVADVGCDHGYLSIYLVEKGIAPKAIAMDINQGPLEKAKEHIREYHFTEYIEPRLSDGIQALQNGEADSLVCAGMGGRLIIKILTENQSKIKSFKELILQPQSEVGFVRQFLREEGYSIVDENMILEDGKFYTIIRALPYFVKKVNQGNDTTKIQDKYGDILLKGKNSVLLQYLNMELTKYNSILAELDAKQLIRCMEIQEEIRGIQKALLYFKEE